MIIDFAYTLLYLLSNIIFLRLFASKDELGKYLVIVDPSLYYVYEDMQQTSLDSTSGSDFVEMAILFAVLALFYLGVKIYNSKKHE